MADGLRQDLPVSYKIYGLYDPRTNALRYIGQTSRDPDLRLREHIRQSQMYDRHTQRWIRHVAASGYEPEIRVLATASTQEEADRIEIALISTTPDLTNSHPGGNNAKWPTGRKHSSETIEKMKKPKTPDHAAAISRAKTGSGHHLAKLCESQVREIKQLLSQQVSHTKIAMKFGVSRITITQINTGRTWSHVNG